jgi:hypothetical protein
VKNCLQTFFFIFWFSIVSNAQSTLDTIEKYLSEKPHLFLKVDSRNSFIENSRAKVIGLKLGISYGHRLHFGIGYNQLYPPSSNFDRQYYYINKYGLKDSLTEKLKLYYISVHMEYVFYQTKRWELSMPLQIGIGQTYYVLSEEGIKTRLEAKTNFIYEPAVSVEYKLLRWLGVGSDVGFRFLLTPERKLNRQFTSPTYSFKLLIYYDEIYKSLFPKGKLIKFL